MSFKHVLSFLEKLEKNNSKDWMDDHRKEYHACRDFMIAWLDEMNAILAENKPNYYHIPGRKAIMRINNNLMFHPEKPVYKNYFGADLDKMPDQTFFYIHIGVQEIFVAGGRWLPASPVLKSIREAIDYNGEVLQEILNQPEFVKCFGALDQDHLVKTAPKGYSKEHPHIDLIRLKSFTVTQWFTRKDLLAQNFQQKVAHAHQIMLPFREYLDEAVSL